MDAIQILNDARAQYYAVEKAKEILATAQAALSLHGVSYTGKVQNGPADPTAANAERIRQAEEETWAAIARYATLQKDAQALIDALEDVNQRLVLEIHYLSIPPKTMSQTAKIMEVSPATAFRYKRQALEALEAQEVQTESRTAHETQ